MSIESYEVQCPYCGENVEVDLEPLEETQSLIEDCSVCCRPMQIETTQTDEGLDVVAKRSD
jgi:hypothetical protein